MSPRYWLVALSLSALASLGTSAMASEVDDCLDRARARAEDQFSQQRSATAARRQLEIDAALCVDPRLTAAAANVIGTVNADRARFARDFLIGARSLAVYRALREDRRVKLAALMADVPAQEALLNGDADADLVPDNVDRCPRTPAGSPTDAVGCPVTVVSTPTDVVDERRLRATLAGSRTVHNKSCVDAPPLSISAPLEWGRGPQTPTNTQGFNIAVAKVSNQPSGCEVFYEIQFHFIDPNPGDPGLPPSKTVTVVFSASEDLSADPLRAVFGLPVETPPLSSGRAIVREAFLREYFRTTWRVRAVNGGNLTAPWSAFVTQGPAPGGVDG